MKLPKVPSKKEQKEHLTMFEKLIEKLKEYGYSEKELDDCMMTLYANSDREYVENLRVMGMRYPTNREKEYKDYVKSKKEEAAKNIIKIVRKTISENNKEE
jgi:hypothetical protein